MDQGLDEPIAYHDALAGGWDARYCHGSFARRARFFAHAILPLLPAGGHWLDAGCGTGTFARIMARGEGRSVAGVDASAAMVMEANTIARTEQPEARLSFEVVQTIEALPFPAAHFDGIICLSVLEYLDRPLATLDELIRVLKRGGMLAISVPHQGSAVRLAEKLYNSVNLRKWGHKYTYIQISKFVSTPRAVEDALRQKDMKVVKTAFFDPIIPRLIHRLLKPSLIYIVCRKEP